RGAWGSCSGVGEAKEERSDAKKVGAFSGGEFGEPVVEPVLPVPSRCGGCSAALLGQGEQNLATILRPSGLGDVRLLFEPSHGLAHRSERDPRKGGKVAQAHRALLVENDQHEQRSLRNLPLYAFGTEPAQRD